MHLFIHIRGIIFVHQSHEVHLYYGYSNPKDVPAMDNVPHS